MKSYRQLFKRCNILGYRYQDLLKTTIIGDESDRMEDYIFESDKYGFRNSYMPGLNKRIDDLFIGCSFVSGDGVGNHFRFSSILNNTRRTTYNCGLSGGCYAQMALIAREIKSYGLTVKRLWFMPYAGAIGRSMRKTRSSNFFGARVSWAKPYYESRNGKMVLTEPNKIKPSVNFGQTQQASKEKLINFNRHDLVTQLEQNISDSMYQNILVHTLNSLKNTFKSSEMIFGPIPNLDLMNADQHKRESILDVYRNTADGMSLRFLDIMGQLSGYDKFYFKKDGHLNKDGHKKIAEIIDC